MPACAAAAPASYDLVLFGRIAVVQEITKGKVLVRIADALNTPDKRESRKNIIRTVNVGISIPLKYPKTWLHTGRKLFEECEAGRHSVSKINASDS